MSESTFMRDLVKQMHEHGVSNFIIAFSDPDSDFDRTQTFGSKFWRHGACMLLAKSLGNIEWTEDAQEGGDQDE